MENLDHQRFCLIHTLLKETSTTNPTSIMFITDWPNNLITCKIISSHPCASDMKDYSEPSNTCNSSRKTQPILPSCQKTSHTSINISYYPSVNELVRKARQTFRQSRGINQENYVIAIAPGENSKEIKFSFKNSIPGLNEFLSTPTIKSVNKDFFEFFVILPEDEQASYEIKSEASRLPANIRVHFIEFADRYGALCASDFGILHTG